MLTKMRGRGLTLKSKCAYNAAGRQLNKNHYAIPGPHLVKHKKLCYNKQVILAQQTSHWESARTKPLLT